MILDTDIGGDPDDVFALLLALASPEKEIDLLVTSNEHKGHRASFAEEIVEALGLDLDIVPGLSSTEDPYCQVCEIGGDKNTEEGPLERLAEVVEEKDSVDYVCIGPQTNLANFIEEYPELASKLEITCMGGALEREKPEYNLRTDVKASKTVLRSEVEKRYVTLDVTAVDALEIDREHELYRKVSELDGRLKELMDHNSENFRKSMGDKSFKTYMHDPLAVSVALGEDFLEFEEEKIALDDKGRMEISEEGNRVLVSKSAEQEEFMEFLDNRLI